MKTLLLTLMVCALLGAQILPLGGHDLPTASGGTGATMSQYKQGSLTNGATTATVTFDSPVPSGHQVVFIVSACIDVGCSFISTPVVATGPTGAIAPTGAPWVVGNNSASNTQYHAWLIPVGSSTSTFTATYAAGMYWAAITAADFSGLQTSTPFDQAAASGAAGTTGTTATVTPSNTTNATDLIIGQISMYNTTAVTPGSGFTEAGETSTGIEMEYKTTSSTGSYPCTWSFTTDTWQGACLAIKLQ